MVATDLAIQFASRFTSCSSFALIFVLSACVFTPQYFYKPNGLNLRECCCFASAKQQHQHIKTTPRNEFRSSGSQQLTIPPRFHMHILQLCSLSRASRWQVCITTINSPVKCSVLRQPFTSWCSLPSRVQDNAHHRSSHRFHTHFRHFQQLV